MPPSYTTFESVLDSISKHGDYPSFLESVRRQGYTKSHGIELFRFLYIKTFTADVLPSKTVDCIWQRLLQFRLLYKKACRLLLAGKGTLKYKEGIIPHDSPGGDNQYARELRYVNTLDLYAVLFPSGPINNELWPRPHGDSSTANPVADPVMGSSCSTGKRQQDETDPSPAPAATPGIEPAVKRPQTTAQPAASAPTITLLFKSQCGKEMYFRIRRDAQLKNVMNAFATELGHPVGDLFFTFLGSPVSETDTPESLGMEAGDQPLTETGSIGPGSKRHGSRGSGDSGTAPGRRGAAAKGGTDASATSSGVGKQVEQPITVKAREPSGEELWFKVNKNMAMRRLMQEFAKRKGAALHTLRFLFGGRRILNDDTPESLGLEEGSQIDVTTKTVTS